MILNGGSPNPVDAHGFVWDTNTLSWVKETQSGGGGGGTVTQGPAGTDPWLVTGTVSINTSGLATSAKQDTGNTSLASIDTKLTNPLPVSASSLPLPTGAATESTLNALNTKVTAVNTGAVVVSSSALPSGASTEATLALIKAKTDNLDVALSTRTKPSDAQHVIVDSSASIAVTGPLTDTQLRATPVPVSGTVTATTGGLTDTQLRASAVPVSLSTLPALVAGSAVIGHVIVDTVPSTAVTNANLDSPLSGLKSDLDEIATDTDKLDVALSTRLSPADTLTKVATVDTITNSVAITATSLPLPSGAATDATLLQIEADQADTEIIDGRLVSFSSDFTARRLQETAILQNYIADINTMLASESENSQRMGVELR